MKAVKRPSRVNDTILPTVVIGLVVIARLARACDGGEDEVNARYLWQTRFDQKFWSPGGLDAKFYRVVIDEAIASGRSEYLFRVARSVEVLFRHRLIEPGVFKAATAALTRAELPPLVRRLNGEQILWELGVKGRLELYRRALARVGSETSDEIVAGTRVRMMWLEAAIRASQEGMAHLLPEIEAAVRKPGNRTDSGSPWREVEVVWIPLLRARESRHPGLEALSLIDVANGPPKSREDRALQETLFLETMYFLRGSGAREAIPRLERLFEAEETRFAREREGWLIASCGPPYATEGRSPSMVAVVGALRAIGGQSLMGQRWQSWFPESQEQMSMKARAAIKEERRRERGRQRH